MMVSYEKELVTQWLLHFSYRHRYVRAISELSSGTLRGSVPDVDVLCASISQIVNSEDIENYFMADQMVTELLERTPDLSVVPFRLYAKLSTALRIQTLFHMLRNKHPLLLLRLNEYYPREGFSHALAPEALEKKLNAAQVVFRRFFLGLITNKDARHTYMRQTYSQEFGAEFVTRTKHLAHQFVSSVIIKLPPTPIDQLLSSPPSSILHKKLSNLQLASVEILLDGIHGKSELSDHDVIEIFNSLKSGTSPFSMTSLRLDSSGDGDSDFAVETKTDDVVKRKRISRTRRSNSNVASTQKVQGSASDSILLNRCTVTGDNSLVLHSLSTPNVSLSQRTGRVYRMKLESSVPSSESSGAIVGGSGESNETNKTNETEQNSGHSNSGGYPRISNKTVAVLDPKSPSPASQGSSKIKSKAIEESEVIIISGSTDSQPSQSSGSSNDSKKTAKIKRTPKNSRQSSAPQSADKTPPRSGRVTDSDTSQHSAHMDEERDVVKKTLPALEKHLRSPQIKLCVVKLYKNRRLARRLRGRRMQLYN